MTTDTRQPFSRMHNFGLLAAVVAGAVCAWEIWTHGDAFLESYLLAFFFWWTVSLGCLGVLIIHRLTGGRWGRAARPILESGAMTMPLMTLAFLPIALELDRIYPWASSYASAEHASSQVEELYLNPPFFQMRAGSYFAVWLTLSFVMCRTARSGSRRSRAKTRLAAGGLVLMLLTCTFAAIDWGMSLDPHWYSTMYGALVAVGAALSGLALTTAVAAALQAGSNQSVHPMPPQTLADLGTLLLVFLMLWAYCAFSQFLIIWSGNLPEENVWYIARLTGGWQWIGLAAVVLGFAVPFCLLLSRDLKESPRWLAGVATLVFIVQWVYIGWILLPSFRPGDLFVRGSDIAAPLALGGLWIVLFAYLLTRRMPASRALSTSLP